MRLVILLANGHLHIFLLQLFVTLIFVILMKSCKTNVIYHKNNFKLLITFVNKINIEIQSWESYFIKVSRYIFVLFSEKKKKNFFPFPLYYSKKFNFKTLLI